MPVGWDAWGAIAVATTAIALLVAAVADVRERRVPDAALAPAALIVVTSATLGRPSLAGGLAGAMLFGLPLVAVALLAPAGLGMGDAKLAAFIGLALGAFDLRAVGWAAVLGLCAGGVAAAAMLARGARRDATMPFAPALVIGAVVAFTTILR